MTAIMENIKGYRLSPAQEHLWLLQETDYDAAYRAQCAVRIEGPLDVLRLKAAAQRVVERHDILRTTYYSLPGMAVPLQVIADESTAHMDLYDLSDLEAGQQEAEIASLFEQMSRASFTFQQSSLLNLSLLTLSQHTHVLLMSLPALCADALTLRNLVSELGQSYETFLRGDESFDMPMRYVVVARWLNELLEAEDAEPGREYWQQQPLLHASASLPFEKRAAVETTFAQAVESLDINGDLLLKLEAISQQCGISVSELLLACWSVLIWRLTGEPELTIGVGTDGRIDEDLEKALGLFAKYLPVTSQLESGLRMTDLLRNLHQATSEVLEWQEFFTWKNGTTPLENQHQEPFFALAFDYQEAAEKFSAGDLTFSFLNQHVCFDRFKLKLSCSHRPDSLIAKFYYDSALFSSTHIERLAKQYHALLNSVARDVEANISDLHILSDDELHQILIEFNNTRADFPKNIPLHRRFEQQVSLTPDAIALSFQDQHLSYAELNARANQLAHYLRSLGVGPEVLVGICIERSLEMVVGLLGILKAGAAYLPLDPSYPQERLSFMLDDAQVSVLLTQSSLLDSLPAPQHARTFCLDTDGPLLASFSIENPTDLASADNLAYIIYTSGSTGTPKGVGISHRAISNHMAWLLHCFPLSASDRVLQKTPFSFDASVWEFFAPLFCGARLVLARPGGQQDPSYLLTLIREEQVTVLQVVPSLLRLLVGQPEFGECESLRLLFSGGEALAQRLAGEVRERLNSVEVYNLYGPTEASIDTTCGAYQEEQGGGEQVPIGRPIANMEVYILDGGQQVVPIGVGGELYIGGEGLARGYLHRPELTAEKFIPHPFSDEAGARLYRTGDLARHLADGNIEYLGRIDHQVKVRGYRIELGEVEAVLVEHESVRECVVVAMEREHGEKQLVAYLVQDESASSASSSSSASSPASTSSSSSASSSSASSASAPQVAELRQYLQHRLPDYMIPAAFLCLPRLPLSANGKLDRRALPPPLPPTSPASSFIPPRSHSEHLLAHIWASVLALPQVSVTDNFFELGGDSILSLQIVSRARQAGLQLTPRLMFQYQTVRQLAAVACAAEASGAEQGVVSGEVVLTPIQRRFMGRGVVHAEHYNQALMLRVEELESEALAAAVGAVVRHHDALRIRMRGEVGGPWRQWIVEPEEIEIVAGEVVAGELVAGADRGTAVGGAAVLQEYDLSELDHCQQPARLESIADGLQRSLSLSAGPLLRVAHFRLGPRAGHRLLIIIHHLAVDGVSWRILLEDLATAYAQATAGQFIRLPEKTSSYQQWGAALEQYAESERLESELEYWLGVAEEARAGGSGVPVRRDESGKVERHSPTLRKLTSLSREQTRSLLQEVPEVYHTQINDVLLAGLCRAVCGWSGSAQVVVEVEGHGREEVVEGVDVTRTVGWFTSYYPVVLREAGDRVRQVQEVKEQLRRVPERGVGYGVLREMSKDGAQRAELRVESEVSFNYLGQFDQVLGGSAPQGQPEQEQEQQEDESGAGEQQQRQGWERASESFGEVMDAAVTREHGLDVTAVVVGGRLQISWRYGAEVCGEVEELIGRYVEELGEIVEQCRSVADEGGGYTASDFLLAKLDDQKLDQILSTVVFEEQQ
jgi:amino acid adenylation domain-containing protein/non-ribosomal peptide synthase protein (TIGR01720 family)